MTQPITNEYSKSAENSPPEELAPPTYAANPESLTAAFSSLNLSGDGREPTRDRCIAHLKLLEAFHQLREDIATSDGLFGIKDNVVPADRSPQDQAAVLLKLREKRWAVYVAKAASRFETWWEKCIQPDSRMLRQGDIAPDPRQTDDEARGGQVLPFTRDNLPPLDVIMPFWKIAFDMVKSSSGGLDCRGMPWIRASTMTLEYAGTEPARKRFETESGLAWDSLNDSPNATVQCPQCSRKLSCPWTTCDDHLYVEILDGELNYGFADKKFEVQCEICKVTIDHGVLRAQKFRRDLQNLLLKDIPMPGTILSINGKKMDQSLMTGIEVNICSPGVSSLISDTQRLSFHTKILVGLEQESVLFPNRLIKHGLSVNLLECTDVRQNKRASVNDIRTQLETVLGNSSLLRRSGSKTGRLTKSEKIAVRRMMSRYWDNSSPFALDLIGAVIRQGSFIEKMHSIDWIHSPAVGATMTRLIAKYGRYFKIMQKYPEHVAVPTLDVDLAWHTHQLSPGTYYAVSLDKTSKFIDHDDKIDEGKLTEAFEWTSKTYERMFSSVYSECTCWYCEATRESSSSLLSRHSPQHKIAESELDNIRAIPGNTSNPHTGPHISAHNAIKTDMSAIEASITAGRLESNYKKASKRARKRGREPPERDSYMYAMAYGYPMYVPYYAPYVGDPCITDSMYPGNPTYATFTPGAGRAEDTVGVPAGEDALAVAAEAEAEAEAEAAAVVAAAVAAEVAVERGAGPEDLHGREHEFGPTR
ncbi:hypothetical protein MMC07_001701 [Pseudocyphellaria aurata]|nr:hypothetical protein [Pseudocyphellaria aurata]